MSVTVTVEQLTEQGYVGKDIEIDVDSHFNINEDNVDGELCNAGRLLVYYGDLSATLKAQAARKKADLEEHSASLARDIRKKAMENGDKITEGGIKEKVLTTPSYQTRLAVYIETEKDASKLDNFFRSQKQRVDCIIALAYKQRTEIAKNAY